MMMMIVMHINIHADSFAATTTPDFTLVHRLTHTVQERNLRHLLPIRTDAVAAAAHLDPILSMLIVVVVIVVN